MPFINRLLLSEPFETWTGMESAAEERYWDGLTLATDEPARATGAIYLFGYVAEMLVKTAYFRVSGVGVNDDISSPLRAAKTNAAFPGSNLHNLKSWADLLVADRRSSGIPIDPVRAADIYFHVLRVNSHWNESIRYKHLQADSQELTEAYESVNWLRTNHVLQWS